MHPHSLLPKPTPPGGNNIPISKTRNDAVPFGKFLRQRSNDLSSAISRGISSIKHSIENDELFNKDNSKKKDVTEFNLPPGLKVVVTVKNDASLLTKGRITFFSRSNCRDCTAVRRFFREKGLRFVEINVDVYEEREKELLDRTGSKTVPKIFFNEKLIGGLVELNALRNGGDESLEKGLRQMSGGKCSGGDAPAPPAYGFDDVANDEDEEEEGEMVRVVRVMRQRLPIQDRWIKMKLVRNCFTGSELVELLVHYLHSSRPKVCMHLCIMYLRSHTVYGYVLVHQFGTIEK